MTVNSAISVLADLPNIEISGGIHEENQIDTIISSSSTKNIVLHNYSPPPKKPFVLNLGSLNEDINGRSYEHIKEAIKLSQEIGARRYAIHAPYCIDPLPVQMGNLLKKRVKFEYEDVLNQFCEKYCELRSFARGCGVDLMIENNVMTKENVNQLGPNGLAFCNIDGTNDLIDLIGEDVSFLIDFAHLKVSAATLEFDRIEFLDLCEKYTGGVHLSDTSDRSDDNLKITHKCDLFQFKNFWRHHDYLTLEVYGSHADIRQSFDLVSDVV